MEKQQELIRRINDLRIKVWVQLRAVELFGVNNKTLEEINKLTDECLALQVEVDAFEAECCGDYGVVQGRA